jgi:hypothetical protein
MSRTAAAICPRASSRSLTHMAWVYALGAAFFLFTGIIGYALTRDATYFAGWVLIPGLLFGVAVELPAD